MDAAAARTILTDVGNTLARARPKGAVLLEDIGWPRELEEAFFASGASVLPQPTYDVDKAALNAEIAALEAIERRAAGDDPVLAWARAVVHSNIDKNRLLLAVRTRAFGEVSREIYGSAHSSFLHTSVKNVDLAKHLLQRLTLHGWDLAESRAPKAVSAKTFAADLTKRIAKHEPTIDVAVLLDPALTSKAIAGMSKVRVRADATFMPWEADGLFCHEVETHAFSAHNGREQELSAFLKNGGPRTTRTQEGLAVFAELYNHALAVPRLERLALRVELVAMGEDGASFIDLYRHLRERGYAEREAFLDAARICRGGMPEGGAPFTKDAAYLAGFVEVHTFLAAFVRAGFRDETELLMCGRIALEDIVALTELHRLGLITRPKHRPRWLEQWDTLLPYFAFTSFMDGIDLAPIEAHYAALIERAAAVSKPAPKM